MSVSKIKKLKCPQCSRAVEKFKSGSHIIPRWITRLSKLSGKNLRLQNGLISNNVSDLTTEAWCNKCEDHFSEFDGFGASFFRDRNFLLRTSNISKTFQSLTVEIHDSKVYSEVSNFVASIFTRHFLDLKNRNDKNATHFKLIARNLKKRRAFYVFILKFGNLPKTIQQPTFTPNNDLPYRLMINGYLIYLFIKKSDIPKEFTFNMPPSDIIIPIHYGLNDAYTKSILAHRSTVKNKK